MNKWCAVIALVLLVLVSAMALRNLAVGSTRAVANGGSVVPRIPWLVANGGSPVPWIPWPK